MNIQFGTTRFNGFLTRLRFGASVCLCALANGQAPPPPSNSYSELTRCCVYQIKATGCIRTCCHRYLSEVRHGIDTSPLLKPSVVRVSYHNFGVRVSQFVERQG